MSNSTSSQRTGGRLGKFDINDLKCIKVAIRRSNIKVNDQATPAPILRGIDEPERLIKVIHYRSDEGLHPIFDRDDIVINKSEDIIEKWVCKCGGEQKLLRIASPEPCKKDTNQERRDYYENKSRTVRRSRSPPSPPPPPVRHHHKSTRYSRSPQPSTSSSTHRYDVKHLRKSRTPPPKEYRSKRDRSFEDYRESKKSPQRYKTRTPDRERKRSRSPATAPPPSLYRHKNRYSSRSPPPRPVQSRHLREVKRSRSRSPPIYHHRTRRSRSRERRYSRSPTTTSSRRIARYSPHHRSRSRSPTKRDYNKNVQIPPELQYYPGEEYWIPGPLAPRYLPRGFIPPTPPPPPPGMYPRVPGMMAPRPIILPTPFHPQAYRQRYPIYNNRIIQPQKPKTITNPTTTTTTTPTATITTATTTTTIASSSTSVVTASSQDATTIVVASSSSNENIDDKDRKSVDANVVDDNKG